MRRKKLCTENDTCAEGVCKGTEISCDDGNECSDDTCDPLEGCKFSNNSKSCDDNDACTKDDVCIEGTCTATAINCACNNGWTGDGSTCAPESQCPDGTCNDDENFITCPQDCDFDIVVIVEDSLSSDLSSSLDTYIADLDNAGYKARIVSWSDGTVD